jgi:hypothetical protein
MVLVVSTVNATAMLPIATSTVLPLQVPFKAKTVAALAAINGRTRRMQVVSFQLRNLVVCVRRNSTNHWIAELVLMGSTTALIQTATSCALSLSTAKATRTVFGETVSMAVIATAPTSGTALTATHALRFGIATKIATTALLDASSSLAVLSLATINSIATVVQSP